jgi:hypothetical protein
MAREEIRGGIDMSTSLSHLHGCSTGRPLYPSRMCEPSRPKEAATLAAPSMSDGSMPQLLHLSLAMLAPSPSQSRPPATIAGWRPVSLHMSIVYVAHCFLSLMGERWIGIGDESNMRAHLVIESIGIQWRRTKTIRGRANL